MCSGKNERDRERSLSFIDAKKLENTITLQCFGAQALFRPAESENRTIQTWVHLKCTLPRCHHSEVVLFEHSSPWSTSSTFSHVFYFCPVKVTTHILQPVTALSRRKADGGTRPCCCRVPTFLFLLSPEGPPWLLKHILLNGEPGFRWPTLLTGPQSIASVLCFTAAVDVESEIGLTPVIPCSNHSVALVMVVVVGV